MSIQDAAYQPKTIVDRSLTGSPATVDHPIAPGSSEDYLQRLRTELDYNSKCVQDLTEKLRGVVRVEPAKPSAEKEAMPAPNSSLADVFATASGQLSGNNEILRDILRCLDLP